MDNPPNSDLPGGQVFSSLDAIPGKMIFLAMASNRVRDVQKASQNRAQKGHNRTTQGKTESTESQSTESRARVRKCWGKQSIESRAKAAPFRANEAQLQ